MIIKLEISVTLRCPWKCKTCFRGLGIAQPTGSDVSPEQVDRLVHYLKTTGLEIFRLHITGGEPLVHPELETILSIVASEKEMFPRVILQTAYPLEQVTSRVRLPRRVEVQARPVTKDKFKKRHLGYFVSPTEFGLLSPGQVPPIGTALTEKVCKAQTYCGRHFDRWGFTACPLEAPFGRMFGIGVHSREYKHWADPDVCRHCPNVLGLWDGRAFMRKHNGHKSKVFDWDRYQRSCKYAGERAPW
jgi:hypothetical protein